MKEFKGGLVKRVIVATASCAAVALALVGTAKPAAAAHIDFGLDIHIGGHDGYGYYDDYRYRPDYRYYDDYRYRHDRDDYRYQPEYRYHDAYRSHRDRDDSRQRGSYRYGEDRYRGR